MGKPNQRAVVVSKGEGVLAEEVQVEDVGSAGDAATGSSSNGKATKSSKKAAKRKKRKGVPRPPKNRKSSAKYADDPTEPLRCHAAKKSDGKRCGQKSVRGQMTCRMHGGKGSGAPIKHGGYSQALGKWRQTYEAAIQNEQMLFDLTETLALSHVVMERAAVRAEDADTPQMRKRSLDILNAALMPGRDPTEAAKLLAELRTLLRDGVKEDRALQYLSDSIERFATRKEKAWDVRLKAAHAMNEKDLACVFTRIIDIAIEVLGPDDAGRFALRLDSEGLVQSGQGGSE